MRIIDLRFAWVLGIVGLFMLGGCGLWSTAPDDDGYGVPWPAEPLPYQSAALEDGVVTDSEYQAAVWNSIHCLREHGVEAVAERQAGGLYQTSARVSPEEDAADPTGGWLDRLVDDCQARHLTDVEVAYQLQNR